MTDDLDNARKVRRENLDRVYDSLERALENTPVTDPELDGTDDFKGDTGAKYEEPYEPTTRVI